MLELRYDVTFVVGETEIILHNPYLTNDFKVAFKTSSHTSGLNIKEIIFNDKENRIDIILYNKKICGIRINKEENLESILQVADIKKKIIDDLGKYNDRLSKGKESIMALYLSNENDSEAQYLFSTKTALYNGGYSVKYTNAIIYYLNKEAEKVGKKIEFKDFTDMQLKMNTAFKKLDTSSLQLKDLGGMDKFYSVSFETMAKLLFE